MNAADIQRIKGLLPTSLGSEEAREAYAAQILRRSIWSARMAVEPYLADLREVLARVSAGTLDRAGAVRDLTASLARAGIAPDGVGLADHASRARLDLIIRTNRQMAASAAQIAGQTADTLDDYPGWELRRFAGRRAPRADWARRWAAAGNAVGWVGAARHSGEFPEWSFVALKASPIWQALGDGAGGFRDALGNPFPPFAFGSGLAWDDVERDRCEALGLIAPGEMARAPKPPDLSPSREEMAEVDQRTGFDLSKGLES